MGRSELEKALTTDIPDLKGKQIWIFGAGNTAALYANGFARLEKEGFQIAGYTDNNESKWGTLCNGKEVVSPAFLQENKEEVCVLICSIQSRVVKAVSRQLGEMGIDNYPVDEVILKQHAEQVLAVYDLLDDEESRQIYETLTYERMKVEGALLPVSLQEQYFALPAFTLSSPGEVFVDCGAYVGDSVERYLWAKDGVFKKIIAFEPDAHNYRAMQCRTERLIREWGLREDSIELVQAGVAGRQQTGTLVRYDTNNGLGSRIVSEEKQSKPESDTDRTENEQGGLRIVALDEYLTEPYSFLKADIEGWEYDMLLGAQTGLKNNRPLLAICIYHNVADYYQIPLLLRDMLPDYHFAIRQHKHVLSDSVLYAWSKE